MNWLGWLDRLLWGWVCLGCLGLTSLLLFHLNPPPPFKPTSAFAILPPSAFAISSSLGWAGWLG